MTEPDFESMNETDVREAIVRPFLAQLGYAHGTQANIRTEVSLKYEKAFLGRKNPGKDPPLAGRADYICEAVGHARWTVEVKAPSVPLSREDVEQAHTYSAHPEIGAFYFLVTNGREFRLYQTGRLDKPLMGWAHEDLPAVLVTLQNILGYDSLKRLSAAIIPDTDKPLGPGLRSRMKIVGGEVRYGEHRSNLPATSGHDILNGAQGAINGVEVYRDEAGMLTAVVEVTPPYSSWKALNEAAGINRFTFRSSEEFISVDRQRPTILQNVFSSTLREGTVVQLLPNMPKIPMPVGFDVTAYTEATGWIEDGEFRGLLRFSFDYEIIKPRFTSPLAQAVMAQLGERFHVDGDGTFVVRFQAFT